MDRGKWGRKLISPSLLHAIVTSGVILICDLRRGGFNLIVRGNRPDDRYTGAEAEDPADQFGKIGSSACRSRRTVRALQVKSAGRCRRRSSIVAPGAVQGLKQNPLARHLVVSRQKPRPTISQEYVVLRRAS